MSEPQFDECGCMVLHEERFPCTQHSASTKGVTSMPSSFTMCCVSDLHGRLPDIPACDVLVIAGDVAPDPPLLGRIPSRLYIEQQMQWFDTTFLAWEDTVPASHILAIPGNHDWCETLPGRLRTQWLIDRLVVINGRRFYGMPWVPRASGEWNFEASAELRNDRCQRIPAALDVLITHAPPFNVLDEAWTGDHAGCEYIREAVVVNEPAYHVFGHIHEGRRGGRSAMLGTTACYNVAMWGSNWQPTLLHL